MNEEDIDFLYYEDFVDTIHNARQTTKKKAKKHTPCFVPNCTKHAINSHLIQQHPLLESICEHEHKLYQLCDNPLHPRKDTDIWKIKEMGIEQVLSIPLFCKEHDNGIFKEIEQHTPDLTNPLHQLLFSYRALCAECFAEQQRLMQFEEQAQQRNLFKGWVFQEQIQMSKNTIKRLKATIKVLWDDIQNKNYTPYHFRTITMPFCNIAISDAYIDNTSLEDEIYNDECKTPAYILYIHLIPQLVNNQSILLLGMHKDYTSNKLQEIYTNWNTIYNQVPRKKIYELLLRTNYWCISPSYFESTDIEQFEQDYTEDKICLEMED